MSSQFKAGFAAVDITPTGDEELKLSGFIYREEPSTGVHDSIYARALVLQTEVQSIALVSLDLIGVSATFVADVRERIAAETGIEAGNIMISASHTHSAPVVGVFGGCGSANDAWLASTRDNIVRAVTQAADSAADARFGFGLGKLEGLTYNRHQVLKDGTVAMPLQKPEDIVKQGTPDFKVRVMRLDDAEGKPIAVWTSFSCHPAILDYNNLLISSDYVGYTRDYIEKELGGGALFATAACGNMNPVNFNCTDDLEKQYQYAEELGRALGVEAVRLARDISTDVNVELDAVSEVVDAPLYNVPTLDQIDTLLVENEEILEKIRRDEMTISPSNLIFSKAGQINYQGFYVDYLKSCRQKLSSPGEQGPRAVPMEIQVMTINEFTLIGLPGEPYVEIGFEIQRRLPQRECVLLELTNGAEGYIPDEDAHHDGGYTVERAHRFYNQLGAFSPDMEHLIVETVSRLIVE